VVKDQGIAVSSDVLFVAGLAIAKKGLSNQKGALGDRLYRRRRRGLQHFTEMVAPMFASP